MTIVRWGDFGMGQTRDHRESPQRLMVVGQDQDALSWLVDRLEGLFEIQHVTTDAEAAPILSEDEFPIALILSETPGLHDLQLCQKLRRHQPVMQIIFTLRACHGFDPSRVFHAGADDFIRFPEDAELTVDLLKNHAELWSGLRRVAEIKQTIRARHSTASGPVQGFEEHTAIQDVAVFTLAKVAESRDRETGDHLVRMRAYSQILARAMQREGPYADQIDDEFLDNLWRSSPLHDIGKVGISDAILLKPDKFTDEEFEVMNQHTIIGANILDEAVWNQQGGSLLAMAALIARFHHEKFNGTGYPAGLVGREIPLPARIVAVADVFDALTSRRPYKRAFSVFESRDVIVGESGKHFDPVIVDAFLDEFEQFVRIYDEFQSEDTLVQGAHAFLEQGE